MAEGVGRVVGGLPVEEFGAGGVDGAGGPEELLCFRARDEVGELGGGEVEVVAELGGGEAGVGEEVEEVEEGGGGVGNGERAMGGRGD